MNWTKLYSYQVGSNCFGQMALGMVASVTAFFGGFSCQVRELTFHVFKFRLRSLKFIFGNNKYSVFRIRMIFSDNMDVSMNC